MKKLLIPFALSLITAFATTSCKKDYTCKCTVTTTTADTTFTFSGDTVINDKKKDAEDWCNSFNGIQVFYGDTIVTSCAIQ